MKSNAKPTESTALRKLSKMPTTTPSHSQNVSTLAANTPKATRANSPHKKLFTLITLLTLACAKASEAREPTPTEKELWEDKAIEILAKKQLEPNSSWKVYSLYVRGTQYSKHCVLVIDQPVTIGDPPYAVMDCSEK